MKIDISGIPKEALILVLAEKNSGNNNFIKCGWIHQLMWQYREKGRSLGRLTELEWEQNKKLILEELTNSWDEIVDRIGEDLFKIDSSTNQIDIADNDQQTLMCIDHIKLQFRLIDNHPPFETKTLKEKVLCWCFFYDKDTNVSKGITYPEGEFVMPAGPPIYMSGRDRGPYLEKLEAKAFLKMPPRKTHFPFFNNETPEQALLRKTLGTEPKAESKDDALVSNHHTELEGIRV